MSREPIKVLLVEDDPGDALLIEETLITAGASEILLESAERLSAGVERLAKGDIDLVLLDLGLPDSQGLPTLAGIHSQAPEVPILVLTGHSDEASGIEAVRRGAQDYLIKGEADERVLVRSIRYAIERKRAENRIVRQSALLAAMNAVSKEALNGENEEDIASVFLRMAQKMTGSEFGFVSELSQTGSADTIAIRHRGGEDGTIPKSDSVAMAEDMAISGIWGSAFKTGDSLIVNDPASYPDSIGVAEGHPALTSFLGIPLRRGGQTVGMIGLANKQGGYEEADQQDVKALSRAFLEALYRKRAEDEVRSHRERLEQRVQERTDELTRLNEQLSREIGDRVRAEQEARASLKEKEALLQEVHHRVKNNLQLICSLLDLQQSRIDDPRTRGFLKDSEERVKSMALIHEQLYKSNDLSRIDFSAYLDHLTKALSASHRTNGNGVTISVVSDRVYLGVDTALPCGLIINELVSNCLKHAFHKDQQGHIRVEFRRNQPTGYVLVVADNGKGLPEEWEHASSESLGLKLVRRLMASLRGSINVRSDEGAEFTIMLNERKKGR